VIDKLIAERDDSNGMERNGETEMPRTAFRLRIRAGQEEEYEAAHRNVWPALLAKLKEVGISKYSIFRREQDLILVMQVQDFEAAWHALDQDPTNQKWQEEMSALFDPVPGLKPGERFAMMKEVFYMD
jgi:L-rhamnose mutarotase